MTAALVVAGSIALVGLACWAGSRLVQHPEDFDGPDRRANATESDQLYGSADRPAGPDAEDPPTAVPNRREPQPLS